MRTATTRERQLLLAALLISSLTGILIWYTNGVKLTSFGAWFSSTARWISFFTNLTNALVVVMAAALLAGRGRLYNWFKSPGVQSAFCLYIAFVGLAYWLLLSDPSYLQTARDWIAEMTAHTLSPILGVVYWVRGVPRGYLTGRHPLQWLLYPLGYLVYWLFRGPLVGYYPYFFVDVDALGYGGVAVWTAVLVSVFLLLGAAMWQLDRWQAARRRDRSPSLTA